MAARMLLKSREVIGEERFVERVVWQLDGSLPGSVHGYKYRLAFVVRGRCVLRYDNEAGKGDHRHLGEVETPYQFITMQQLLVDFWQDVDSWRDT